MKAEPPESMSNKELSKALEEIDADGLFDKADRVILEALKRAFGDYEGRMADEEF